ncbi:MAG: hypothetical protein ACKVT0_18670 [Planctomycetaceae bacterium]
MTTRYFSTIIGALLMLCLTSCSSKAPSPESAANAVGDNAPESDETTDEDASSKPAPKKTFRPVQLGGGAGGHSHEGEDEADAHRKMEDVMTALKPLQVVLGNWNGITKNKVNGFNGMEVADWVWDLKTDPHQPALVLDAPMGNYIHKARLTYDADNRKFQLTTTDADKHEKVYAGEFTQEVEDVPGDDKKLQRTFELTFVQVTPPETKKSGRLTFRQLDNNRYQMEVADKRGKNWHVADIVANQRQGTSFALSDTDYGDKTCIISQGLGTISISYQGKTFWVCCSGCKAAFEEDPKKWIARMEEREKMKL